MPASCGEKNPEGARFSNALRRYELKQLHPAAARARALLEELAPTAAEETLV
jgi:hypothetical protein